MGGPGSGSWYRWDTRRVIDTADCLDVRRLSRQGAMREGVHAILTWRQGQQAEHSLEFACESRGIVLAYRTDGAITPYLPYLIERQRSYELSCSAMVSVMTWRCFPL